MPVEMNFRLPDVSFLNYMGELQADALGMPAIFNSSDPVSYFEQSVDRLNSFLTQSGSGIARNGLPYQQQRQGTPIYGGGQMPPFPDTNSPVVNPPVWNGRVVMPDGTTQASGQFDLGQWIGKNLIGEDYVKRFALFLLAAIIVAAAVFSLR